MSTKSSSYHFSARSQRRDSGFLSEDGRRCWSPPPPYQRATQGSLNADGSHSSESCDDEVFVTSSSGYYSGGSSARSQSQSSHRTNRFLSRQMQRNDLAFSSSDSSSFRPIAFDFNEESLRKQGIRTRKSTVNARLQDMDIEEVRMIYKQYRKKSWKRRWFSDKGEVTSVAEPMYAYHYHISSIVENRCREKRCEPFQAGTEVDGPSKKHSPSNLWKIACRGLSDKEIVKIPHTSVVKKCSDCRASGHNTCRSCSGMGNSPCYHCNGNGRITKMEHRYEQSSSSDPHQPSHTVRSVVTCKTCHLCGGYGFERCTYCHGSGHQKCQNYHGKCQLVSYDVVVVRRKKYSEKHYTEVPDLPTKELAKGRGFELCKAKGKSVSPLTANECIDTEIIRASQDLTCKHQQIADASGKLLKQEHGAKLIPVYRATVHCKGKEQYFWIIGQNAHICMTNQKRESSSADSRSPMSAQPKLDLPIVHRKDKLTNDETFQQTHIEEAATSENSECRLKSDQHEVPSIVNKIETEKQQEPICVLESEAIESDERNCVKKVKSFQQSKHTCTLTTDATLVNEISSTAILESSGRKDLVHTNILKLNRATWRSNLVKVMSEYPKWLKYVGIACNPCISPCVLGFYGQTASLYSPT